METKTYKKAEIRIVRFDESDVVLTSEVNIDVFDWFEGGEDFLIRKKWRDENG